MRNQQKKKTILEIRTDRMWDDVIRFLALLLQRVWLICVILFFRHAESFQFRSYVCVCVCWFITLSHWNFVVRMMNDFMIWMGDQWLLWWGWRWWFVCALFWSKSFLLATFRTITIDSFSGASSQCFNSSYLRAHSCSGNVDMIFHEILAKIAILLKEMQSHRDEGYKSREVFRRISFLSFAKKISKNEME